MARDFIFALMLGSSALIGAMAAVPALKGWKALLVILCGVASVFLIWNLASLHLPR